MPDRTDLRKKQLPIYAKERGQGLGWKPIILTLHNTHYAYFSRSERSSAYRHHFPSVPAVGGHKVENTLGVSSGLAIELSFSPPILKFLAGHKVENAPLLDLQVKNWLILDARSRWT